MGFTDIYLQLTVGYTYIMSRYLMYVMPVARENHEVLLMMVYISRTV